MSSPSTDAPGRGRPARLDRTRTVDTALDLLDEHGLEALTMRRLAGALDVQAGALYRYFATKEELLTAMAERMLAGAAAPGGHAGGPSGAAADGGDGYGGWEAGLAGRARALRSALLARRDGARVHAGTHPTGPHTLGFAESVVAVLREAGFGDEVAARTLPALADYTVGHTLEEQAASAGHGSDGPADPGRLRGAVADGGAHPHLAAVLPVFTSTDFEARFEFGLRLLIEGLRTLHRAAPPAGR